MKTTHAIWLAGLFAIVSATPKTTAASRQLPASLSALQAYFAAETKRLNEGGLADVETLDHWTRQRAGYQEQLREMLGLDPWPERTDLQPVVTGTIEEEEFTVEKLHFQSRPGLYVTANLYLPKPPPPGPIATILYVCGHGPVIKDGISYGNKAAYQHHGAWFARHGYVCLVIDTLQLGEIEGIHHGTYREGMWWWNSRGYTPAGVEAWNSIRALDYLSTRPEVDTNRFGVTGRSGGGAYSWWLTALDERVRATAPVAGITDLHDHVVDGVVEGHCDCMFIVNTHRWDYPQVAALVAPRPLLLVNTDQDSIFPLNGVMRVHHSLARLYEFYQANDQLGLVIGPGPHKDTQNLQVPVLRWFNQHLKHADPIISVPALKFFEPEALKVFAKLPSDQINTTIHESFVARAPLPRLPRDAADWAIQRDRCLQQLARKVFGGWPVRGDQADGGPPLLELKAQGTEQELELSMHNLTTQPHVTLPLYLLRSTRVAPTAVRLNLVDQREWTQAKASLRHHFAGLLQDNIVPGDDPVLPQDQLTGQVAPETFDSLRRQAEEGWIIAWLAPRGVGPNSWDVDPNKLVQIRRRFMLLGQTLDGMRVWDARRAMQALHARWQVDNLHLHASGEMACHGLYASLFEPHIGGLQLERLPTTHEDGPHYLNVLRFLDIPQAVALAAERSPVRLQNSGTEPWLFPIQVGKRLGWPATQVTCE